jgi:hypothetical protein
MATQLHVALSNRVHGIGIFAGGIFELQFCTDQFIKIKSFKKLC